MGKYEYLCPLKLIVLEHIAKMSLENIVGQISQGTGSVNNSRQTKDTASGFNSANVLVKSKIQNENYQINRLKHLKNTE